MGKVTTSPGPEDHDRAFSVHSSGFARLLLRILLQRVANLIPFDGLRSDVYRLSGVRIGKGVFIGEGVLFDKLTADYIEIGDRTAIGARTIITAHQTIPTNTRLRRLYPDKAMKTVIENDVWIMPGVIIIPGVRVGHHSVIATGAVIHKDVPPYSLVVGGAGFRIAKQLDSGLLVDPAPGSHGEESG